MEYALGMILALAAGGGAASSGFDRDRSFYPTVLIVIATYYVLFAAMSGIPQVMALETAVAVFFLATAIFAYRRSLWIVPAALLGHGLYDFGHFLLFKNPGAPPWWPAFCASADFTLAAIWSMLLRSRAKSQPML